jgi:4-amino-4-deoxy-L-arabinose transferase-like glycosyltransferase
MIRRLRFGHGLTAVLALALAVRLLAIVASPHFRPINDAADFDRYAVSIADHGTLPSSQLTPGPTAFRAPLFPLALAAVYKLVGVGSATTRWAAGRVLDALFGTATVGLICLVALRLWDRRVALVSGAIAAVYPPLVLVGSSLMSESLYIPLGLAAVLAALAIRDAPPRLRSAVLTGVLTGLAALARSTDLILLIPIALIVWSERPRRSWSALRMPLIVIVTTLLTLVPWTVRNAEVMHTFVPITDESGYALAGTYNSVAQDRSDYPALWTPPLQEAATLVRLARGRNEAQFGDRLTTLALHYIKAHPSSLLKTGFWNTLRLFNLTGTGFERYIEPTWGYAAGLAVASVYAFWLIGALAIAGAFTRASRRAPAAFWICPVVLLVATVFLIGSTRYRSPADPWFVILAALGTLSLWSRVASRPKRELV